MGEITPREIIAGWVASVNDAGDRLSDGVADDILAELYRHGWVVMKLNDPGNPDLQPRDVNSAGGC